ncbi:MAG: hypothetical protein AB8G26_03885, partial [Ilumatobacter sp.]
VVGLVAATVAYASMGLTWDGDSPYALLAIQLAVLGAGIGLTVAPTTSAVVDHAEPDARGAAAAAVMVIRMIGLSVGLSALTAWGLARFNTLRSEIDLPPITDPGFQDALTEVTAELTSRSIADTFLASALALGVGLAVSLALLRKRLAAHDHPDPGRPDSDPTRPDADERTFKMTDERRDSNEHDASPAADGATDPEVDAGTDVEVDADAEADADPEADLDVDTREHDTFVVAPRMADTDELPTIEVGESEAAEAEVAHDSPEMVAGSWAHRHLGALLGVMALLLIGAVVLTALMFARVNSTEAELADTRADLQRVEAGAAIFASQVNGFVEAIDELGPEIDSGLDQAVTQLEEFGTSTIEFDVAIDETISIDETFVINRTVEVPINTSIPINEEVETTITIDGPFGIDIPLDITVPVDLDVPIDLTVDIPINEELPVAVDVPVQLDVPISISVEGTELQTLTTSLIEGLRSFQDGLSGLTSG